MKKIILILSTIFIIACSNSNNYYFNSTIDLKNDINNKIIITDMVDLIKKYYPKQSKLYLNTNDINKVFFNNLCNILRKEGFAISNDNSFKDLNFISYTIYQIDENIFAIINIDANKVNITYRIKDNKIFKNSISFFDY